MNRRELLKKTPLAIGGAITASTIAAALMKCTTKKVEEGTWKLLFLSDKQFNIVQTIADRIVPKTDSPGALDALVPQFIDMMLFDCYNKEQQDMFIRGIEQFGVHYKKVQNEPLGGLTHEEQDVFLTKYEQRVSVDDYASDEGYFMKTVRELTLNGFFMSEPGATKVLNYVPVPGRFNSCIDLTDQTTVVFR